MKNDVDFTFVDYLKTDWLFLINKKGHLLTKMKQSLKFSSL